jgi:hypothetical protein
VDGKAIAEFARGAASALDTAACALAVRAPLKRPLRCCGVGRGTLRPSLRYMPAMSRAFLVLAVVGALSACAGPRMPAPNSAIAEYDVRDHAVHVMISGLQPASAVALIGPDGSRYPAVGFSVISGPHVLYNPPPSIGLGIGGFGFTGCCSGIGSGIGFGVPIGGPTVAEASDQYVTSALITAPPDYGQNWSQYRLEVAAGNQAMTVAAPAPAG